MKGGERMSFLLLAVGIYVLLGIISTIVIVIKEPIILHAWILLPIVVLGFPYWLWVIVIYPDNTGRWI
jgi:hypothetical protein